MDLIETLKKLEPVFMKAGQLAYRMQKNVHSYNKFNTGNPASDIVTDADLAAQEFLLKEISKTDLINCTLLAEEDTPSVKNFTGNNGYYLGIDPIDDTAIYTKGGKHFSVIVSLHNGKEVLYVFVYFPAWDWIHKVVNGQYSTTGEKPDMGLPVGAKNSIVYWEGSPEKNLPKEILSQLKDSGLTFIKVQDWNTSIGSIGPFASEEIAGVYQEDMNTYDGLVELSIAKAKGLKIYPDKELDLKNILKREKGLYYPEFYLVLNNLL